MKSTMIVLGYQNYGNIGELCRCLKKRGKNITLIIDDGKEMNRKCYDDIIKYKNLDADEILGCVEEVAHGKTIEDIINITDRLTYVHLKMLQKYCGSDKQMGWLLNARIKPECRRLLSENNISPVQHCLIKKVSDLSEVSRSIGYPSVIKPVGGRGSDCVYKIHNEVELRERYHEIANARIGVAVSRCCDNFAVNGQNYNLSNNVIVEEYLPGTEYTVDGYIHKNNVVVVAIQQKCFGIEDNGFRDLFYITPPVDLKVEDKNKIEELVDGVRSALKMNNTLYHIELRVNNGIPKIIEVNPRLGGGTVHENIVLSAKISLLEIYADIICDRSLPELSFRQNGVAFGFGVVIPKNGKISVVKGVDDVNAIRGLGEVHVLVKKGDIIKDLVGERYALICSGLVDTHEEAFAIREQVNDLLKIEMEE